MRRLATCGAPKPGAQAVLRLAGATMARRPFPMARAPPLVRFFSSPAALPAAAKIDRLHVVLDQSGSMRSMNETVYEGARELLDGVAEDGTVCVTRFADEVALGTDMTPRAAQATWAPSECSGLTLHDVLAVQSKWAKAIETISATHKDGGDFIQAAADAAGELYCYGHSDVLFKPTKAAEYQFRPTPESAMSYFVGGSKVDGGYDEDSGFAINGGKGWSSCVYDNHNIVIKSDIAIAMGNYTFTCATTNEEALVEYTFGYERCDDGVVRIFLHHSSIPFVSA